MTTTLKTVAEDLIAAVAPQGEGPDTLYGAIRLVCIRHDLGDLWDDYEDGLIDPATTPLVRDAAGRLDLAPSVYEARRVDLAAAFVQAGEIGPAGIEAALIPLALEMDTRRMSAGSLAGHLEDLNAALAEFAGVAARGAA